MIARKEEGVSSHNINFEYNSLGQLIQQNLASSEVDTTTQYQWDSFGNPVSQSKIQNNELAEQQTTQHNDNSDDSDVINKVESSQSESTINVSHSEYSDSSLATAASDLSEDDGIIQGTTDADRLTHFGDSDFHYDEFGNQIRETGKGIKTRREYNAFNQLSCFNNNGTLTQYDYDPLGRRIAKHTEQGKIDYIWDNDQLIGEYQHGEYTWYINLPNQFHPVALIKQGEVYYYHLDQLNTPRFVTNNKAEVVWENQADVYGYEELKQESLVNTENSFTQPIRFQGQYLDEESGLHYNRYRYYSPKQQRFINQDPIGLVGGINHYQYAPNPVNWVDPFGLMCKEGEASLKEALNNCTQSGVISPELSDKLYLAAQDGNLTPKEIKHGLAALAVAKVAPVQPIVNPTTTSVVRIAAQTAANDALFVAERSLLATVAPWLARAIGTVSLLAYSPSTGGALEELTAPDGTIYSKHSDEVFYKAVGVDGDEWSTTDPQQDMQFRMWKANGGEGSLQDWLSQGMPEKIEIKQKDKIIATDDVHVEKHGLLKNDKTIAGQSHHLNQNAAFELVIPKNEAVAIKLEGNAFTDIDSGHYKAHESLEAFWANYRRGGKFASQRPTNAEYSEALYESLLSSGLSAENARIATEAARNQRLDYGLEDSAFVPRVPSRLGQRKR